VKLVQADQRIQHKHRRDLETMPRAQIDVFRKAFDEWNPHLHQYPDHLKGVKANVKEYNNDEDDEFNITWRHIQEYMHDHYNKKLREAECRAIIKQSDKDCDGEWNFVDFCLRESRRQRLLEAFRDGGYTDEYQKMVDAIDRNLNLTHDSALKRKQARKTKKTRRKKTYKGMPLPDSDDDDDNDDSHKREIKNADDNSNKSINNNENDHDHDHDHENNNNSNNNSASDKSNKADQVHGHDDNHHNIHIHMPHFSDSKLASDHSKENENENEINRNSSHSCSPFLDPNHWQDRAAAIAHQFKIRRPFISTRLFLIIITGEGELTKWRDNNIFKKLVRANTVSFEHFVHVIVDFDLNPEMHVL
jgi:hypothetical protein